MPNYTLDVISHHPQFTNKSLRKHYVNGIETVGAWGDEPFEISFKNNTWQKVQVKLSVDGTDLFTGKPADTDPTSKMWVVNGYETLSLKAWPEDNNGGAAFVFTSANNSVAIHTHGDLSSRGIIAAAVFVEGHVEPVRVNPCNHYHYHYPYTYPCTIYPCSLSGTTITSPTWMVYNNQTTSGTLGNYTSSLNVQNNSNLSGNLGAQLNVQNRSFGEETLSSDSISYSAALDANFSAPAAAAGTRSRQSKQLESLVAVGAGQHVDQKIVTVPGLIKPILTETVRVRYMWWDDLVAALRAANVPEPHPSGFPGDTNQGINLGNTPRLPKGGVFRRAEVMYSRV